MGIRDLTAPNNCRKENYVNCQVLKEVVVRPNWYGSSGMDRVAVAAYFSSDGSSALRSRLTDGVVSQLQSGEYSMVLAEETEVDKTFRFSNGTESFYITF